MTLTEYRAKLNVALDQFVPRPELPAPGEAPSILCIACGFDSDDVVEAAGHLRSHER